MYNDSAVDSNPNSTTSGLELGMAGMSLLSSSSSNNQNSKIKSRSPVPNSGDSVQSILSTGTAGSINDSFASGANMNRPPGLAGLSVPPIGKPGHAKSASNASTAHTTTLTPTSSIDGGANDLYAGIGGRGQSSPSSTDHIPGIHTLGGSFDKDEGAHDGLMGLSALRERSQSSPGPTSNSNSLANAGYASSPREFSANARGFVPQSQQQGRPRLVSKDGARSVSGSSRPPLAGGPANVIDGMGFQSSGNRSRDASPPPNAGVISRPDSQFSGYGIGNNNDSFESSLHRALSSDAVGAYNSYGGHRQGSQSDNLNSTFAPSGLSNQRIPGLHGQGGLYQNHHNPQSQPSLRSLSGQTDYYHEANFEAGFMPHRANSGPESEYSMQQPHDLGYHHGHQQQYQSRGPHRRSMSMQHNPPYSDSDSSQGMYGMHQRQSSLGRHDGAMQRRKSDFGVGGSVGENTIYERGGNNYHRQDRLVSPAHSPMHSSYGSHNRHPSDISGASTASPSMSVGSAVSIAVQMIFVHKFAECPLTLLKQSLFLNATATLWSPPPCALGRRSFSPIGWGKY